MSAMGIKYSDISVTQRVLVSFFSTPPSRTALIFFLLYYSDWYFSVALSLLSFLTSSLTFQAQVYLCYSHLSHTQVINTQSQFSWLDQ